MSPKILRTYERHIVVVLATLLVAVLSFEIGFVRGKSYQESPVLVSVAQIAPIEPAASISVSTTSDSKHESIVSTKADGNTPSSCPFLGSKNSDKVHIPTCQWAKRIKPENIVCYASFADATASGRVADSCIQ